MENLAPRVEGARPATRASEWNERGKKRSNVSRWLFPTHPVAKSNLLDPFLSLSRSLFALVPRLADTVSDKNLGLRVNVGSQLFVFLYGLILWPMKR